MISHQHKCILVHVPKTAGQSIEHVFLDLHGLTWETKSPLLLRLNTNPDLGPRRLAHLKAREYVTCGHMTQEQYDAYFKFSFVRNPWSRMVSLYKALGYNQKYEFKHFVMKEFVEKEWEKNYWLVGPQSEFNCDQDGSPLVDFIGRFENLQDDFNYICQQIGIPAKTLGHVNKAPASQQKNWRDYYDNETKEFIADLYQRDINLFGYEFD